MKIAFFVILITLSLLIISTIFFFGYLNYLQIKTKKIIEEIKKVKNYFNEQIVNTKNFKKLYEQLNIEYDKKEYDDFWVNFAGFKLNLEKSIDLFLTDESFFNIKNKFILHKQIRIGLDVYKNLTSNLTSQYNHLNSLLNKMSNKQTEEDNHNY